MKRDAERLCFLLFCGLFVLECWSSVGVTFVQRYTKRGIGEKPEITNLDRSDMNGKYLPYECAAARIR